MGYFVGERDRREGGVILCVGVSRFRGFTFNKWHISHRIVARSHVQAIRREVGGGAERAERERGEREREREEGREGERKEREEGGRVGGRGICVHVISIISPCVFERVCVRMCVSVRWGVKIMRIHIKQTT